MINISEISKTKIYIDTIQRLHLMSLKRTLRFYNNDQIIMIVII